MTEPRDEEHHEEPEVAAEGAEDERINDPLTRVGGSAVGVHFGW